MTAERHTLVARRSVGKWLGTFCGAVAWFADQQIVSATVYARCPEHSRALVLGVGAVCLAIAVIGGLASWWVRQSLSAADTASASVRTDRFIASLSLTIACVSILAIVFGTAAGLILRCERF